MLTISLVFGVNDLLALKGFNTFLNNFLIHESPNFIQRYCANKAKDWLAKKGLKLFRQIQAGVKDERISLALNETNVSIFTTLALADDPLFQPQTGEELFLGIASTELAFIKLQKPRQDTSYTPKEG
jgi:hypothetical protein